MRTYHQYCPIARTSEILSERWTPLVVRNLLFGADTFTQIANGVPTMSRSVLATRLRQLEGAGVVRKLRVGSGVRYRLTEAGRDLVPTMEAMASWGERWLEVTTERADPGFAMWAWCKAQLNRPALPIARTVVAFTFPDQAPSNSRYWLLVENGDAEVCFSDPGDEPAAEVVAESLAFVDWHRGELEWSDALRSDRIQVTGDRAIARSLPTWNLRHAAFQLHSGR